MTHDPMEVLSAFVDGEVTDPVMLAEALAAPGAREALIDFVRLRVELAREPDEPPARLRERFERELRRVGAPRRGLVLAGVAAAVIVVGLLGVLLRDRNGHSTAQGPPPAQREIRFTEGVDWFSH